MDTWFAHQHEEIIEKLKHEPLLQLAYVLRVINDKEADIESTISRPQA